MMRSITLRFWDRVEKTERCWLWRGATNGQGYGVIGVDGHQRYAHRLSYELFVGPIPDGLELDHLCRTPACVNPAHLEPVTHQENIRRGFEARGPLTHCTRGHAFDEVNTYVSPIGFRSCRQCARDKRKQRVAA